MDESMKTAAPRAIIDIPIHMPGNNRNWETVAGTASILSDGTVQIKFKQEASSDALVAMAEKNLLLQLAFDYRMDSDALAKINTQFQKEYHDESTLDKVHKAIRLAPLEMGGDRMTDDQATWVITCLQNAGILFRERK